jgi:hypothetical protein
VLDAIAELGYEANLTARSLRSGKSRMLGLVLSDLSAPYYAELASRLMAAASARGYRVLVEQSGALEENELSALQGPFRQLTDGLLFTPLMPDPDTVAGRRGTKPLVMLGEHIQDPRFDLATMKNVRSAEAMTAHLLAGGCRRIAVIGAGAGDGAGPSGLRLAGYRQALAGAGVDFDPALIVPSHWRRDAGASAVRALLDSGVPFDAVFGLNDALALGVLHELLIRGRRQEALRQQEHLDSRAAHEAQTRLTAERSSALAVLAPVQKDEWWDKAQPGDIAKAYAVAESWKDHDPAALEASAKIREEVLARYGLDTHDVGTDTLDSGIATTATEKARLDELARSQEEARKAAAEHEKAMQLIAAAQAEERRAQATKLAPEMQRHQVPIEYLANPELVQALQRAHNAKTPKAAAAADADIKERMFLIGKDGINGPDIDQLRKETTANLNGAGDAHFQDPMFVKAVKEMHEAKLLAEAGFKGSRWASMDQRYERAEKELFARLESVGREIENRVTGSDSTRLDDQGLKAETGSVAGYGSAEHHEKFAESLENTGANDTQIRGRLRAARSEGTHPSAAVTVGKATKARKTRAGATVGAERAKNGLGR